MGNMSHDSNTEIPTVHVIRVRGRGHQQTKQTMEPILKQHQARQHPGRKKYKNKYFFIFNFLINTAIKNLNCVGIR